MTPTEALARALDGDDTPPWEVAERLAALGYEVRPIEQAAEGLSPGEGVHPSAAVAPLDVEALAAVAYNLTENEEYLFQYSRECRRFADDFAAAYADAIRKRGGA